MPKKNKVKIEGNTISGTTEDIIDILDELSKPDRNYMILEASLKDGLCNYVYEITKGTGIGDKHVVKGQGIYKDELQEAFKKLNVHLAYISDVFKHSKVKDVDINKLHNHDLTYLYTVTGFKIKGDTVVLIGYFNVSLGGAFNLESPKITLDNLSSYKWYNELKAAVDTAQEEVALYKEGKVVTDDNLESDSDYTQMTIDQNSNEFDNPIQ